MKKSQETCLVRYNGVVTIVNVVLIMVGAIASLLWCLSIIDTMLHADDML
jgi:hypothetical protein